jgi:hypothetical protein
MKPPRSRRPLLPCDVQHYPQLPVVAVLRAAAVAAVPALLHAHPAVAAAQLSTTTEVAADDVVHLVELLRIALDNYRRVLRDAAEF